jgi:tungstate transport system ATP-binding protein
MELKVEHVRKAFRASGTQAFELQVDALTFASGSLTYIIGHNGSGKSLFARLLAGELRGDSHLQRIWIEGASDIKLAPHVTLVRQRPEENVCSELSVEENFIVRGTVPSFSNLFSRPRLVPATLSPGSPSRLTSRWNIEAGRLSTGERQLLAFECARRLPADAYILDEFTASLDPAASQEVMPLVHELLATPAPVVLISHDIGEVQTHADRVIVFVSGRIIVDEPRPNAGWPLSQLQLWAAGQVAR